MSLYTEKDIFWKQGKTTISLSGRKCRDFINKRLGIWVFKEGGETNFGQQEIFVLVENGIIDVIDKGEVKRLLQASVEDPTSWKGVGQSQLDDAYDAMIGIKEGTVENILKSLPVLGENVAYFRDTKTKSYVLFAGKTRGEEVVVEITSQGITKMNFDDLPKDRQRMLVWRNQFIKFPDAKNILKGKKPFKLVIAGDAAWKKIDGKQGDWNKYVKAICSFPKRDDDNNITSWDFDQQRYDLLKNAGGYLAHTYKDKKYAKAIVLVDSDGALDGKIEGGSGKSIFLDSVKHLRHQLYLDGPKISGDGASKFIFMRCNKDHSIIFCDDVLDTFRFQGLFSAITTDFVAEGKGTNEIAWSFTDSPKFSICTNYALNGEGESFDRRQFCFEVSSFFTAKETNGDKLNPISDFFNNNTMMSADWNDVEWNCFYNWWFRATQHWLQNKDLPTKKELEGRGISLGNLKMRLMLQAGISHDDMTYYQQQIKNVFAKLPDRQKTVADFIADYVSDNELGNQTDEQLKEIKKRVKQDFVFVVEKEGYSLKRNKGSNRFAANIQGKRDKQKKLQEVFHILGL
jgi:hypothetical protein